MNVARVLIYIKPFFYSLFFYLILIQPVHSSGPNVEKERKALFDKLAAYSGERTFIFSFPGSANTWMRYCLEYLTQRPSFARFDGGRHPVDMPLGLIAHFPIDMDKAPLEKVHSPSDILAAKGDIEKSWLIFIVRNPKEALARHFSNKELSNFVNFGNMTQQMETYFDNIQTFHNWDPSKRILIYYEDLITFPQEALTAVLQFMQEPIGGIVEFMRDYSNHKKIGLAIKERLSHNFTNGEGVIFHSNKLTKQSRETIDKFITERYPLLWEIYLKERYAEK